MRHRAVADRTEVVFTRIALQQLNEFGHRADAEPGVDGGALGCVATMVT